ncbi:Mannose-P-dolichol utilization defect 1 protein homolog [Geodia barretti]|uniref:Mannose-P-dolichol utilization defect 1 protein homolog n=1 Tax=Geodia barretti TaxID=519541 RepID=A0AA35WFF3_GEOBA|nr:Mannose-P-dolichol utilization defect 1 protein homolog [Geodia barretti]
MESLKGPLTFFFPGDCYEEVVVNYNIFDGQCLKLFNSRLLSLGIILGSVLVKVPQILKCVKAGSVENLSYLATFLELAAATFTCAYNHHKGFAFSSWGESFFIAIQVVVLLALMFVYDKQTVYLLVFLPCFAGVILYLVSGLATPNALSMLQTSVIPMMLLSRLSQIVTTFKNGATGQLSLITCTMNWLGTGARIFTTLQETQDPIILATFTSSFLMNTIILAQFACYPALPPKPAKKES